MIKDYVSKNGTTPKIACMGLAYKPDVDDLRESPALQIVRALTVKEYDVYADEPNISKFDGLKLRDIVGNDEKYDIYIYLVMHSQYKSFKPFESSIVLDYCGLLD